MYICSYNLVKGCQGQAKLNFWIQGDIFDWVRLIHCNITKSWEVQMFSVVVLLKYKAYAAIVRVIAWVAGVSKRERGAKIENLPPPPPLNPYYVGYKS